MPSCKTSVAPSVVPPLRAVPPISFASRPNREPSFTARFLATLPISFSIAASPPTPISACGKATPAARIAVSEFSSCPTSRASDKLPPARGTNSDVPAPTNAPALKTPHTDCASSFSKASAVPSAVFLRASFTMRLATTLPALLIAALPSTAATPPVPPLAIVDTNDGKTSPPDFPTCMKKPSIVGSLTNSENVSIVDTGIAACASLIRARRTLVSAAS